MGAPRRGWRTESPEDVIVVEPNACDRTAVLVLADPDDPCTSKWMTLIEDCLSTGEEVYLYLIDRGVLHLLGGNRFLEERERLKLYACAYGARRYHVPFIEPVVFAGLTVLSNLITGCTTFVSAAPIHGTPGGDWVLEESFAKTHDRSGGFEDIVVYIRSDPVKSHLPVEGLRIASGLTIADPTIKICLDRNASSLLDRPADDIIDGDKRDDYIEILGGCGVIFYCERKGSGRAAPEVERRQISGSEARNIVSNAGRLIVI
jgi:hypothetical protein